MQLTLVCTLHENYDNHRMTYRHRKSGNVKHTLKLLYSKWSFFYMYWDLLIHIISMKLKKKYVYVLIG